MRSSRPERFDLAIAATMAVLIAAIGLVVARGDQIGIAIQSFGPQDSVASRSPIRVVFDEPITPSAIDAHFTITPLVPGKFTVSHNQVTFLPGQPMSPGQEYTVAVKAGIQSSAGRSLRQDIQWHFRVRAPRVAYLEPVDSIIENLYLVDPASPGTPQELTQAEQGVLGFDPALEGSGIVYMPLGTNGTASLYFWDAATGASRLLYECKDAACSGPAWRPDGGAIAFERVELNTGTGMSAGAPRVWVLDLASNTARPCSAITSGWGTCHAGRPMARNWLSSTGRRGHRDPRLCQRHRQNDPGPPGRIRAFFARRQMAVLPESAGGQRRELRGAPGAGRSIV